MEIFIYDDIRVTERGMENCRLTMTGCPGCLAGALADSMGRNPLLFTTIVTAIAMAASKAAQNDQKEP